MDKLVLDKEAKNAVVNESAGLDAKKLDGQLAVLKNIGDVLRKQLLPGIDYGIIPGTKKPTLLQPGAEKICICLGITDQYKILQTETLTDGSYEVIVECSLYKGDQFMASKMAIFNSKEKKGSFNAPKNTCLQMAQKRALVSATKRIGALSGVFNQESDEHFIKSDEPREQRQLIGSTNNTASLTIGGAANAKLSKPEVGEIYQTLKEMGVRNYKAKMREVVKAYNVKLKEKGEKHIISVYSLTHETRPDFLKHMTEWATEHGTTPTDDEGADYE